MPTEFSDKDFCNINAAYVASVFDIIRREYPSHYIFLKHSDQDLIAVVQLYDHRRKLRVEYVKDDFRSPMKWLSVQHFLDSVDMFHERDEFVIVLADGEFVLYNQFDADILLTLLRQNISSEVKMALHRDQRRHLPDDLAVKYNFNAEEQATVSEILDAISSEVMADLQFQYDHLKNLSFIEK